MSLEPQYKRLTQGVIDSFRDTVYQYYGKNGRSFPWRDTDDPYHILVSEIMLQQTQVERVRFKYQQFIMRFPNFAGLSRSPFQAVLAEWQGLGYNRRAMALHKIARRVVGEFEGQLPHSVDTLRTFPGIGRATAGAVAAFAFHKASVFIETNIRRVFLHCFFPDTIGVKDSEILPLVERTLDKTNVRDWYYALMDYGTMLKTVEQNPNRRSAHHHRQAPFHGSDRQIRGLILKALVENRVLDVDNLVALTKKDSIRTRTIIDRLVHEGFLDRTGDLLRIAVRISL
jgi:A/G-specific adenine glycosylase